MAKRVRRRKHKTNFAAILVTTGILLLLSAAAYALPPPRFVAKLPLVPDNAFQEEPVVDKRQEFGIAAGGGLDAMSEQELKEYVSGLKALGVTWVRYDINWNNIQRGGPKAYDWGGHDRIVEAMSEAGIKSLGILLYTPQWARSLECRSSSVCPPSNPQVFKHFAAEVARRYAPQGVHTWEVWNEPNWEHFWQPSPDPSKYAELLKAAASGIRAYDDQAVVLVGGLSGSTTTGKNISPADFMHGVYKAGAGGSFDAVGVHPYTFPLSPRNNDSSWWHVKTVRSVLTKYNHSSKKVWITEYGAPTGGSRQIAYTPDQRGGTAVTEEVQVQLLKDSVLQAEHEEWIGPFFWYSYQDLGISKTDKEHHFGLLRHDGSKKPAFDAYKKAVQENSGQ